MDLNVDIPSQHTISLLKALAWSSVTLLIVGRLGVELSVKYYLLLFFWGELSPVRSFVPRGSEVRESLIYHGSRDVSMIVLAYPPAFGGVRVADDRRLVVIWQLVLANGVVR